MRRVFYIGYYADQQNEKKRSCVLAAVNKMRYICSAITRAGHTVEIISASEGRERGRIQEERVQIAPGVELQLFPSHGAQKQRIRRVPLRWLFFFKWALYICRTVKKSDCVLVYHSLGYMGWIRLLKKLIGFRLLLEVEEIYADVIGDRKKRKKELAFFQLADAYIFPTELLEEQINPFGKPSIIIYGSYQLEPAREKCQFEASVLHPKKHLLYAGTFDPRKGAVAAAAAAANLDSGYHLHILGFGNSSDTKNLQDYVEKLTKTSQASITMDGLLSGEEYIRFVQSCDVGFSTQTPDAAFNDTSFPSKVLSYLSNGLRVVSVRIPTLERSKISSLLYYYDGKDPTAIAEAVQKIDWDAPYDSRALIQALDDQFVREIGQLLA